MEMLEDVAAAAPVEKARVLEPVPAMPRSPKVAEPFDFVVAVRVPWSVPGPPVMLAVTTAPATATPFASLTTTIGCVVGVQTSESSAVAGGCLVIVMTAAGPAAPTKSLLVGVELGLVTLSGPQVTVTPAKAAASSRRGARRDEAIRLKGGWGCRCTCRNHAAAGASDWCASRYEAFC